MSAWSKLISYFGGSGGALSNPDKGAQQSAPSERSTAASVNITDERAMQISTVFACVRLLTQTGATMPLGFYERTKDGREELDGDHKLVRLLKYQPNAMMSAKAFRQAMFASRVLWGNAYAHIDRIGGEPVSLIPLKPELMRVSREKNSIVYTYTTEGGPVSFAQSDILHWRGFSIDGINGISPLGYAREALGISIAADSSAAKAITGKPSGVLEVEGYPDDAAKKQLREMYGSGKMTTEYSNGLMIAPGGMKYRSISIPPDDLQLLESRNFSVLELARFFGVPAVMIDGATGATAAWPASYEQQVLSFLTFGLKPYLEEFEDAVMTSLLNKQEQRKIIVEHNAEGLLRTDSAARSAFYSTMVQNGLMTRNEVRRRDNLPPIAGADELTVQVNLSSIDDLPKGHSNVAQN